MEPIINLGRQSNEIICFEGEFWGPFEAPWKLLEALGSISREPKPHFGKQLYRNHWFKGARLGPMDALGTAYIKPEAHFDIQLSRNHLFYWIENGSRRPQKVH